MSMNVKDVRQWCTYNVYLMEVSYYCDYCCEQYFCNTSISSSSSSSLLRALSAVKFFEATVLRQVDEKAVFKFSNTKWKIIH